MFVVPFAPRDSRRARVDLSHGEVQSGGGGDHGLSATVDGVDDLGVVDALQIDRRDPEVRVLSHSAIVEVSTPAASRFIAAV